MMRVSIIIGAVSLAMASQAAQAKDSDIGYKSPTKVEGICGEKDGTYWATPDGSSWGCGYNGGGGIMCDKGGKDDKGNNIPSGCLETTRTAPTSDNKWGLAGLLGLIGLLGLMSRGSRATNDRHEGAVI